METTSTGQPAAARRPADDVVLSVENLRTELRVEHGIIRAVDNVSFTMRRGDTLGIVGESGCGKSMTALSIMGLLPQLTAQVQADKISFMGKDLLTMKAVDRRGLRGRDMAMIFQEPMTSLNPVFTVGEQVAFFLFTTSTRWRI